MAADPERGDARCRSECAAPSDPPRLEPDGVATARPRQMSDPATAPLRARCCGAERPTAPADALAGPTASVAESAAAPVRPRCARRNAAGARPHTVPIGPAP